MKTFYLHPGDVGLTKAAPGALRGGSAADNARIIIDVLDGKPGPARDVTVLNAGAALFVAGQAESIREGMNQAAHAIDRGSSKDTLARLVAVSQEPAVGAKG